MMSDKGSTGSNLARAQQQTQRDRDGALTSIPGSNLLYGKRGRDEGIFYKEGEDYSLIRGKRTLTGTAYCRVGSEWKRNKEVTIDSTIPKEISLYENDQLIYQGGVKDGQYHGHGTIYKNGKPIFEGDFENGKKCGEGCEFDDNGLFIKKEYKDDQAIGISSEEQEFRKSIDKLKKSYEKMDSKLRMADTTYCDFIVQRKRDPKYQESPLVFYGYVTKQGDYRVIGKEFKDTGYDHFEGVYDEQGRYCYGTLWCDSNIRFEGSFENGKMKHGKLFYQKIMLYEGDVSTDGQMHGEGSLYYTSKMNTTPFVQYEGSFQNGKPEGFGKVFYNLENETEKRLKYCGYFKNGLFDGRGIYFSKDLSYCCGSSLEWNEAESKKNGSRIDKNEVEDIMKACSNMSKDEFDLLSYKYSIANMNPVGGWKEGQLDGHVKITSKHTPPYLVKMVDHKPTFVWDMMIDNKKYNGEVIIDDKSDISLLYFNITFTTYDVEFDKWKYEIIRDERGELSGSIYYNKKLLYYGPIKNFVPNGEGQLLNGKDQKYADGTFDNGRMTLCKMEINGYKYELKPTNWDWKKPESWKLSGTGKVYQRLKTSKNKDIQVLSPEYYLVYEGDMIEGIYEGKGKLYEGNPGFQSIEKCNAFDTITIGEFRNGELDKSKEYSILYRSKTKEGYTSLKIVYYSFSEYILRMYINEENGSYEYDNFVIANNNGLGWYFEGGLNVMYGAKNENGMKEGKCAFYKLPNKPELDSIFKRNRVEYDERKYESYLTKKATYKNGILEGNLCYIINGTRIEMVIKNENGNRDIKVEKGTTIIHNDDAHVKQFTTEIYRGSIIIYESNDGKMEYKYEGNGAGTVLINKESKCSFEGEWHDNKIYKGQLRFVKDGRIIEGEWKNGEIDPQFVYTIRLNDKDYKKGTLFNNYNENNVTECKIDGKEYKLEKRGRSIYCEVRNENEILYEGFAMKKANSEHAMSNSGMIPNRFLKWEYIPDGLGQEYEKGKLKYSGNYVFGKREGNGKEYKEDGTTLLFEGNWKNDQYENGVHYQNDSKIECNFGELSQIHNVLTYKNAKVYKNDILLYQGSIYKVGNEYKPVEGTWYISFFHPNARYAVKSSDMRDNRIHIKNSVFEYIGSMQREDSDFNMSIEGEGELIHNGFAYDGKFEGFETISECTLSRMISNGQRMSLFYGEVKSLMMYAGILFDSTGISEGLFEDNRLKIGYVFNSAGYCIRNVGDVSGYERMYSEKEYKYRKLFREKTGVILHYPATQSTPMNQFTPNVAKPGNQPTPNVATPDNAYKEVKKIANDSAVVFNEGGKYFIRMA